ncbi:MULTISPECIES: CAP domain-containing protein [Gordonia]|nr:MULTISPECIES: CAP domain-containing protein [Gordonia]WLP93267.1 CAP domain-containing protein [Gordonia sp. NB41Y]
MVPDGVVTPHDVAEATNRFRLSAGLVRLTENPRLQAVAQRWSRQMADHNRLAHNPWGAEEIPSGWTSTAENVLQSWQHASADDLLAQWAGSPGHRDNILDPAYTDLGVGVAVATDGKLYATQVLARY